MSSANAQVTQQQKTAATDSVRVSLLTCAAGGEIYSLFENYTRGIDAVFNYGMFNFNAPNFIFRFALGETDYQLGVTDYEHFAAEYNYLGRDVWQQTLNLTEEEKERLIALLTENYRPENRVYRYNFFYDNCATRPRDQIVRESLSGICCINTVKAICGHVSAWTYAWAAKQTSPSTGGWQCSSPSTCRSISIKRRLWTKKDKHGHWLLKKKKS